MSARIGARMVSGLLLLASVFMSAQVEALSLVNVVSRKTHGLAGTFDLPVNVSGPALTVEPRAIGAGHLIIFVFDETLTATGAVTVVDPLDAPIGNASAPVLMGNEVHVTVADVPDRRTIKVTLTGVTGPGGSVNASAMLGLLLGSVFDGSVVAQRDVGAGKSRAGLPVDLNSFRFDLNTSGSISAADIAAAKTRLSLSLSTDPFPLGWGRGGWNLDLWQ